MTLSPREYQLLKSAMSDKLRKLHSDTRKELARQEYSFNFKNKPLEKSRDNLAFRVQGVEDHLSAWKKLTTIIVIQETEPVNPWEWCSQPVNPWGMVTEIPEEDRDLDVLIFGRSLIEEYAKRGDN